MQKERKNTNVRPLLAAIFVLALCGGAYAYHNHQETACIPEELLAFARTYPEAKAFVRAYPCEFDKLHNIDLSGEVQSGSIPLLLQWDKRWGYELYGDGWIGNSGCGPTVLSMVVIGLTGNTDWHPLAIARYAEEQGWYIPDVGTSWDLMTEGAAHFGLKSEEGVVSGDYIRENLSPETPLISSMSPGDFTTGGHFIVLTGINSDGSICVNDPNSPNNSCMSWSLERLVPQIKHIWKLSLA